MSKISLPIRFTIFIVALFFILFIPVVTNAQSQSFGKDMQLIMQLSGKNVTELSIETKLDALFLMRLQRNNSAPSNLIIAKRIADALRCKLIIIDGIASGLLPDSVNVEDYPRGGQLK